MIRPGKHAHFLILTASIMLLLAALLGWAREPARAQSTGEAAITPPDFSAFPKITFFLTAFDASGRFIPNLSTDEVQVVENGAGLAVETIREIEPGLQVILAINTGKDMATRVADISGFQQIQAALVSWANTRPAGAPDDFTFITNDGPQIIHDEDPRRLESDLSAFQPDLLNGKPSLSGLLQALDMAVDSGHAVTTRQAVLYITTLPDESQLQTLDNLTSRAEDMDLRVFVWLAAPSNSSESQPAEALRELAVRTGGEFFHFSGAETLPNPESYFSPLRKLYQVEYQSAANESGRQTVAVEINRPGVQAVSETESFNLTVEPPNPIFINPPAEIRRMLEEKNLLPGSVVLSILIEFPDGYERALKSARLYVDGQLVAERLEAPFDQFNWPLEEYASSARHLLHVEVEDSLGLKKTSGETPVDVLVEQSRGAWIRDQISPQRLAIGGAVLLAAVGLVSALWISGRRGWLLSERRKQRKMFKDPVTQPVAIPQEEPRRPTPASTERASWPRQEAAAKAPAWLVRVNEANEPITGTTVPLLRREMTIGSSPQQAACVIPSATVDELHARLWLTADGEYMLADAGSVAGTWVNFSPVSRDGVQLEHGDLIHIGQVVFRFEMANPPRPRIPQVTRYEGPVP